MFNDCICQFFSRNFYHPITPLLLCVCVTDCPLWLELEFYFRYALFISSCFLITVVTFK